MIAQRQVTLPSCGATSAKVRGGKKFTTVTARWARCGNFAKVLLKGKLPSPTCGTLQATIKAKRTPARSFTGALSTCGDGFLDTDGGETCDASASGGDAACPGHCLAPGTPAASTCMPTTTSTTVTGSARTFDVNFAPPAGLRVAGVTVLVDYPEAQVVIPGSGGSTSVKQSILNLPQGAFSAPNDLDYALREAIASSSALTPGRLFTIQFQDCQGATPPTPQDFTCTVEDASDPNGNTVSGVTCTVSTP